MIDARSNQMTWDALMTSADVALALKVGVSSVKRWTDEGVLASVRTPGGHRRYSPATVHEFATDHGYSTGALPPLPPRPELKEGIELAELLLSSLGKGDAASASALVLGAAQRYGLAHLLDEVVGVAMRRVGDLWSAGEWAIDLEHRASYMIAEIVDRLRPAKTSANATVALLACPPGEQHELPLRMVRVILEHHNWSTAYLGANVPWQSTAASISRTKARLVLFSARESESFEDEAFAELARKCASAKIDVGVGGWWARGGASRGTADVCRFRTLTGFERWLKKNH